MSQTDSIVGINDLDATELPEYRPLCVPAALGLVLGALSVLAFLHPVMWFLPAVALAVNLYALRALAASDRMIGRQAAVCGLFLSLLFGAAAPARTLAYQWLAARDAGRFGRQWLEAVLAGDLHKAHQMSTMPADRKPLDDQLPGLYEKSSELRAELESYSQRPVVSTLRALGSRATVRHYQMESSQTDGRNDLVQDVYAVTFDERGQKKTFFIKLNLLRNLKTDAGPRVWRVQEQEGGYRPKDWQ